MKNSVMPKLRFKEFGGAWEKRKIGEVLTIGSGKDYKHLSEGNIPVYGTGGIMTYVNDFIYEGQSVGIGRKGTIDKPVFLTGKFWTVDTLFYTHKFKEVIPFYIYIIFQKINWKLYNEASGVPSLSKSTIEKIDIAIPTVAEQEKIAAYLSAIDKKISLLKEKENELQLYKKGIMQKIFSQSLRFKDEEGKEFEEWEEKRLGEVCFINMGQSPDSNTYNQEEIGMPLIQGNADIKDRISSPRQFTSSPTKFCEKNDILFTVRAPVGYIGKSNIKACVGRGVAAIRPHNVLDYVYQYLLLVEDKWDSLSQGSTFTAINSNDLKQFKLPYPCLAEQEKIANFLSAIDEKIEKVKRQLEEMQAFKKGMLQQLFV